MNLPKLPVFFPDATRGLIKSLDTQDIENTKTSGILVNTYHLYKDLGIDFIKAKGGIKKFMNFDGYVISDSGGFQIGSLIKMNPDAGFVNDEGATFKPLGEKKVKLSPEDSISFQIELGSDMVVVLDDFTDPNATYEQAKASVDRTIRWAKRSKDRFVDLTKDKSVKPLLLGVVQGGYFQDLRKYCCQELEKIGFDGFGYGGWPLNKDGSFDFESAKTIVENTPKDYLLYGLGVGMPEDIVNLSKIGYNIFDCVLPTRDARHGRAYVFNDGNINSTNFYNFLSLKKGKMLKDDNKLSDECDCLTCTRYTRSYLAHLFKTGDSVAGRLLTIHNLRFYSMLMEKIRS